MRLVPVLSLAVCDVVKVLVGLVLRTPTELP